MTNEVIFSGLTHVANLVLSFSTVTGYRSIQITDRFSSTSINVINCPACTFCRKTTRRERFREHLYDVEPSKPVTRHCNVPQHSTSHKAICGPSLLNGGTESCTNLEQKFIFQIGILNPRGINERFWFNQFIFVYLFHSISLFISFYVNMQVSTNSVTPSSPLWPNTTHNFPPFAPMKGQRSKRQLMFFKLCTVVKFKLSTPQLINPILRFHSLLISPASRWFSLAVNSLVEMQHLSAPPFSFPFPP